MLPVNSAAKEPPTEKKASPSPSSFPLKSLPDELSLNCLARVSSQDLAALPFVSKRYHSLVASSKFKEIRWQLGCIEECLYICLRNHFNPNQIWYLIRREKPETLKSLVMSTIPSCPFPRMRPSMVVLDWGIYVIGGFLNEKRTSDVCLLDCRTNTWRNVPSMRMARAHPAVGVVDGKIYVFGGDDTDSLNLGEVFDPKTQTWDTLLSMPDRGKDDGYHLFSMVMEKKIYGVNFTRGNLVYYSPGEGKWGREMRRDLVETDEGPLWKLLSGYGVNLEKLLYGFDILLGKLFWRESDEREWKRVKGLEARFYGEKIIHEVSNFGLNLVFIWFEIKDESVEIWCCEVSLKRDEEKGEVWGMIEWSGVVGTIDDTVDHDPLGSVMYSYSVNM